VLALWLGAGSVGWLMAQTPWRKGRWFGVGLYLFASYLTNLLVFRGNIGEIWAYALAPVLFAVLYQGGKKKRSQWWLISSVVIAATLLSHNLFGLMIAGLAALLSLVLFSRRQFWSWLGSWVIGTILTMWFWLPAILELPLIVLQQDSLANQAQDHLLTWSQVWFSPLTFGFSRLGPLDTLGFGLGLASLAVIVGSMALAIRFIWRRLQMRKVFSPGELVFLGLIIFTIFTVWISTNSSRWVWDHLSVMSIMQFPWRWLMLTSLALVALGAGVYTYLPRWGKLLLWLLLLSQVVSAVSLRPADRFHHEYRYYLTSASTTLTRNEDRPVTLTKTIFESWWPEPTVATGSGQVLQVDRWNGSHHRYVFRADTDVIMQEPTVYFPGWTVRSGADDIPVEPKLAEGLIAYRLPARPEQPYIITTRFTEATIWRKLGDGLSLLGVLSLLGWGSWLLFHEWRNQKGKS